MFHLPGNISSRSSLSLWQSFITLKSGCSQSCSAAYAANQSRKKITMSRYTWPQQTELKLVEDGAGAQLSWIRREGREDFWARTGTYHRIEPTGHRCTSQAHHYTLSTALILIVWLQAPYHTVTYGIFSPCFFFQRTYAMDGRSALV